MDAEPSAKRRRTLSPELSHPYNDDPYPARFLEKPAEGDEAYRRRLEQAFADPRFRDTLAEIVDKYGKNGGEPAVEALQLCQPKDTIDGANATAKLVVVGYQVENHFKAEHGAFAAHSSCPGLPPSEDNFATVMPPIAWSAPNRDGLIPDRVPPGMPGTTAGRWCAPNGFTHAPGPWPGVPSVLCSRQTPMQHENKTKTSALHPPPVSPSIRGNVCPPRLSKNGKRLGRPPKSAAAEALPSSLPKGMHDAAANPPTCSLDGLFDRGCDTPTLPKGMHDVTAYGGEGDDGGASRSHIFRSKDGDAVQVEDEDADVFWEDIAEAIGRTHAANRLGRKGAILSKKRRRELSGGSVEKEDPETVEKEQELRKLYRQLMSCESQVPNKRLIEGNEGHRRSQRKRKPVEIPDKVPWETYCAGRRAKYKITMVRRSLAAQERRLQEQERQSNDDAEAENNEKTEPAEQCSEQKAAKTHAATPEPTVTSSQETAIALTNCSLATPHASPQNEESTKRYNTETYDEECLLSDDEAPAILSKKVQPKVHLHESASRELHGAIFRETAYALSNDESPTTLKNKPHHRVEPKAEDREHQIAVPTTTTEPDTKAAYRKPTKRAPNPWAMPECTVALEETRAIFAELEGMG